MSIEQEANDVLFNAKTNAGKETNFILRILYIIAKLLGLSDQPVIWVADSIHTPNTDRSIVTSRHRIRDKGTLTNVFVNVISGSPTRNIYCKISLEDESQNIVSELARGYLDGSSQIKGYGSLPIQPNYVLRLDSWGYVTCTLRLQGQIIKGIARQGGWSGSDESSLAGAGNMRTIVGTNPAANVEISETVPTGARWRIKSIYFTLTTSGTSANRNVRIASKDSSSNLFFNIPSLAVQAASKTISYQGLSNQGFSQAVADVTNIICLPDIIIPAEAIINTATLSRQQSDDFSSPVLQVEDWIVI